jgi:hypothetical protein
MAYLKSGGLLIVIDLVVEGGRLEACLVLAEVDVLRGLEDCSGLVLDVLRRNDGSQTALDGLPGRIEGTADAVTWGTALGSTVVVDGWLEPVVGLAADVGGLALAFHLRLVTDALLFLCFFLYLSLVLGKYGIFGTGHLFR